MKKRLMSMIIIVAVAGLTAMLVSKLFSGLWQSPQTTHTVLPVKKDTVYIKTIVKSDTGNKTPSPTQIQPDDQALNELATTEQYLNSTAKKLLPELEQYQHRLQKLYKIKGLRLETNKRLKNCLKRILLIEETLKVSSKFGLSKIADSMKTQIKIDSSKKDSIVY